MIFKDRILARKQAERLDYPVYRKFLQVFRENLEEGLQEHLLAMVLYGSVARGSARPESDIDLIILYRKGKINLDEVYSFADIQAGKSPEYQRLYKNGIYAEISPLFMTPEEIKRNPLILLDIMDEGIILFEQGKCFTQLLEKMRAETKKLGSRKVNLADGSWYWELKPSWKPGDLIEVAL